MRRIPSIGLGAILTTLLASRLHAQSAGQVPADVRAAHEFLFAAYPDLLRQPTTIHLKPEGVVWLLSVAEAPAPPPPGAPITPAPPPPVLLRGTIAFDARGKLAGYQADGPYLNDGANAVLREQIRNHPQWIQSDADVELMRLGGAATVGQAFAPTARPESAGVGRHLGSAVTAGAAAFALRAEAPGGGAPVVKAVWLLEATATDSGGSVQYQFTYEPVGGRLIGVTKVGGAQ
jgi:hypothetical protein